MTASGRTTTTFGTTDALRVSQTRPVEYPSDHLGPVGTPQGLKWGTGQPVDFYTYAVCAVCMLGRGAVVMHFVSGVASVDLSGWGDFAVVIGAATAALLGLLFVAVSIRVETIAKSAELGNRSAQTMALLLTGLLAAALLAVPDQRKWVLGLEYLVLALVITGTALALDRRAGGQSGRETGRRLDAINPTIVTCSSSPQSS